jgi:uncharacterized protein YerC
MVNRQSEQTVWFFLEPVAAIVVGLVFYFPLDRKDLAELTAIFGALLVVANLAQTLRLRREFAMLAKLSEIVDLSQRTEVANVRELLRLYISIKESELVPLRDDAIDTCMGVLAKLAHDKVSGEIGGGEYHIWLNTMLTDSPDNGRIRVVCTMDEKEWMASQAEKRYLEAKISAAQRGVKVDRIFVTTRARLSQPLNQAALHEHIKNSSYGIVAHVVWREDLEKRDPELLREVRLGFITFDDRVALIDVSMPPDEMRGFVTMSTGQIKSLHRIFDRLMQHAQVATPELMADQLKAS